MKKYRILDGKNLDKHRLQTNPIWPLIQNHVYNSFGRLANLVWGSLQNDNYLLSLYIKEFKSEKTIQELQGYFSTTRLNLEDTTFLEFARKYEHYANINLLRHYDDFNIHKWFSDNQHVVIALLGNKGSGKTSFLMYLLKNLPDDIVLITDDLSKVSSEYEARIEIYESLIKQIDDAVLRIGDKNGLNPREILNLRYYDLLRKNDAITQLSDDNRVLDSKEILRRDVISSQIKFQNTFSRESMLYLLSGIQFLKSMNQKVCIVFDDADRIKISTVAMYIRLEAIELSSALNIPVVLSIREITARRIGNKFHHENKYHIIPPTFEDILLKRLENFKDLLFSDGVVNSIINGKEYSAIDYYNFVVSIAKSIISKRDNLLLFYMLSNSNIEIMLDYFKCLVSSSHLDMNDINNLIEGHSLPNHKILETLLLYVYKEMNKSNTYILNMYEADDEIFHDELNNLFRIRIVQIICKYGDINDDNRKYITFASLSFHLERLGYINYSKRKLKSTISKFVDYAIIETTCFNDDYDDDTQIILNEAAYYYIDYLIFTYRYLQTIIPDTTVDYFPNSLSLHQDLRLIDQEIEKFITFIKRCEDREESEQVAVLSPKKISYLMRIGYEQDKERQKRPRS